MSERDAMLVAGYRNGLDSLELAKIVDLTPNRILTIVEQAGVPLRGRPKSITDDEMRDALKAFHATGGWSNREYDNWKAAEAKAGRTWPCRASIRNRGLWPEYDPVPPIPRIVPRLAIRDRDDAIRWLYANGVEMVDIARGSNIHLPQISRIIPREGRRPPYWKNHHHMKPPPELKVVTSVTSTQVGVRISKGTRVKTVTVDREFAIALRDALNGAIPPGSE